MGETFDTPEVDGFETPPLLLGWKILRQRALAISSWSRKVQGQALSQKLFLREKFPNRAGYTAIYLIF
jgi:hypothetical protein